MSRKHVSRATKAFTQKQVAEKQQAEKSGFTRREFLTECAFPAMTATMMSPVLEGLFRHAQANAEGSPASSWVRFVHIHLSGGWGFNGTFVGKTDTGAIVSRATMVNHGIAMGFGDEAAIVPNLVTQFGAQMYPGNISFFTRGLLETLTDANARNRTRAVIYHSRSPDDNTAANQSGLMPMFTLAGMSGVIAAGAGTDNVPSGNGTAPLASDPSSPRLTVSRAGDIMNALAFSRQLTNFGPGMLDRLARSIASLSSSRMGRMNGDNAEAFKDTSNKAIADFIGKTTPEVTLNALNPSQDPAIATLFGLTPPAAGSTPEQLTAQSQQFANQTTQAAIQATMVKAALDGNVGPIAFSLNGYDYHATAQQTTNQRNLAAGRFVGQILQAGANKGVTVAVYVPTDGGLSHNPSFDVGNQGSSQYSGDREAFSGAALFVHFAGTPPVQNVTNVGSVDATSGTLVATAPTGNLRMASAHAFWNIALLSGKAEQAEASLAAAGYSRGEIDTLKSMPTLFQV